MSGMDPATPTAVIKLGGQALEEEALRAVFATELASLAGEWRVIVVHEAPLSLGFGSELAAVVQEKAFGYLHTPILRVTAPDVPYHFSIGDECYRPNAGRIRTAIERAMEFEF